MSEIDSLEPREHNALLVLDEEHAVPERRVAILLGADSKKARSTVPVLLERLAARGLVRCSDGVERARLWLRTRNGTQAVRQ